MALTLTAVSQLCDYCHQRPQHSQHKYCSKTCAAQASAGANSSNMCSQCQKKSKFQNFEFCGKTCAAQAIAQRQAAAGPGQRSNASNPSQPGINPIQVAQFIAQQVPHVKAFLAAMNGVSSPAAAPTSGVINQAAAMAAVPAVPRNNPFLQQPSAQAPVVGPMGTPAASKSPAAAQQPPSAQQPITTIAAATHVECLVPGCGKPVHTDVQGVKTSDYCSKRHREEAVATGLAEPCILCRKFPQGDSDYFCSRMCRDEAMAKMPL